MKKLFILLMFSVSSLAIASNCPNEMKEIDAKLSASKDLSGEKMTKVKNLRAEGEKFHKEGKHTESMKSLQEAKALLGI
jgi:hypothetical protein